MRTMQVLQFQGISWVSKIIKWMTRGKYSHSALRFPDGDILESWEPRGVRIIRDLQDGHKKGTRVDCYEWKITDSQFKHLKSLLPMLMGKKYDFKDVLRFSPLVRLFIGDRPTSMTQSKFFCSELVIFLSQEIGSPILNGDPRLISPNDVIESTELKFLGTDIV